MTKKFCRKCGVRLTKDNKYRSKNSHSRGRICLTCYNSQQKLKKRSLLKSPKLLLKGKYRKGILEFDTLEAKRAFIVDRVCQSVKSPVRNGHSSRVGQHVDHIVRIEDEDTGLVSYHYEQSKCVECNGDIRYDSRGFKICENCGLDSGMITFEHEMYPPHDAYNMSQRKYYCHARRESYNGTA